jgi:hypothetical protein
LEEFLVEEREEKRREYLRTQKCEARIHDHVSTDAANAGEAPPADGELLPLFANGRQNSNNFVTPPLEGGSSAQSQKIVTPLQEAIATPPVILSVVDSGMD